MYHPVPFSVLIEIPTKSASKGLNEEVSVSKLNDFFLIINFSIKLIIESLFAHLYSPLIKGINLSSLSVSFLDGILFINDISSNSLSASTTSFSSKFQNSVSSIFRLIGASILIVANSRD